MEWISIEYKGVRNIVFSNLFMISLIQKICSLCELLHITIEAPRSLSQGPPRLLLRPCMYGIRAHWIFNDLEIFSSVNNNYYWDKRIAIWIYCFFLSNIFFLHLKPHYFLHNQLLKPMLQIVFFTILFNASFLTE